MLSGRQEMPKHRDSPQISVRVSIRQANATPAQSAAWRRLWERLLAGAEADALKVGRYESEKELPGGSQELELSPGEDGD